VCTQTFLPASAFCSAFKGTSTIEDEYKLAMVYLKINFASSSCFHSTAVPNLHLHSQAVSFTPSHHAINHQHPVFLPEVQVLAIQLCLANGLGMLLVQCLLPLELLVR
jgi:hypothetical protein